MCLENQMPRIEHDYAAILQVILDQYQLPLRGDHGLHHWARVWTNGHWSGLGDRFAICAVSRLLSRE
jgi:hypothetical protein